MSAVIRYWRTTVFLLVVVVIELGVILERGGHL